MKSALHGSARAPASGPSSFSHSGSPRRCRGLTLVEMLVSMAITLIMLFAIVQIFALMGEGVNAGRAMISLSSQLRQSTHLLQQDLDGLTCPTLPWAYEDGAPGYFEYIEGPLFDTADFTDRKVTPTSDVDDILVFTSRRKGKPFKATVGTGTDKKTVESRSAEIVWFCYPMTATNPRLEPAVTTRLYRLVVPVRPEASEERLDGTPGRSLQELTRRDNRFLHLEIPQERIHELSVTSLATYATPENLVMANVLSFDVRAFHPVAQEKHVGQNIPLSPNDQDYGGNTLRDGAYVDLGCGQPSSSTVPNFQSLPYFKSQESDSVRWPELSFRTWDTWPFYYERDGVDQDEDGDIDEGTNGIDNDGLNDSVDDAGERETMPPYPYPLRGIQVRIRVMEPDTGQIRQVSMVSDFVPG